jgi:hypothetical protein
VRLPAKISAGSLVPAHDELEEMEVCAEVYETFDDVTVFRAGAALETARPQFSDPSTRPAL